MPVVHVVLEDTNRTILSNVYYKIIEDIVDRIKIPYGTLVVLHKDTEITLTDNRTNTSILDKPNIPSTVSKRRIHASITEEYNEDELTTTAVNQFSAYPIFKDSSISVDIYPIYVKSDLTIEFSYITPSKIEANKIRDDIRLKLSQTRNIDIHEVEYSVLLPDIVEDFIVDVYELKNRLVPETLEEYFISHTTNRIHPITDLSNKENTKLAIYEKQVRIIGIFDFSSMPEKIEADNESNNYKFTFTYKLSLDVPRAIAMRYPIMICNRLLPNKYIEFIRDTKLDPKEELRKVEGYTSGGIQSLSIFEAHRQLEDRVNIKFPINIPNFDDFNVQQGHKGYAIIASFLTDVDETDMRTLFNLREITPYEIHNDILEYIKEYELARIVKPYMSFMYLGLHQEGRYFDADILEIDEDFNIRSKVELKICKPVRVTLSYCIDFSALYPSVMERLENLPNMLIIFLNEHIDLLKHFKTLINKNYFNNTFVYMLIKTITSFLLRNDLNTIRNIINVIRNNSEVEYMFSRELTTRFIDVYDELVKKDLIAIDVNTYTIVPEAVLPQKEQDRIVIIPLPRILL